MASTTAAGTGIAISPSSPAAQTAGAYAALNYIEINNVESIGAFGAVTEVVTFQPLKGPLQKYKGPTNYGSLTLTLAVDDADDGQTLLAIASAPTNGSLYAIRVIKPDGGIRYFQVRVFGMPETIGAANSMITAAPVLEINTAIVRVGAGAPAAPIFTVQPTISPTGGTVGTTFNASDGAASNATSYSRRWLLNGVSISTGSTVTPNAAGTLVLEVTATGPGGSSSPATSASVNVTAAAIPAPVFTTQPSMSPTSGTAGATTFTATNGTASNATGYTRRWLLNGTSIGTGTTVTPASAGTLVLEVTATGAGGSTVATTAGVTVAAAPTPAPVFTTQPSISPTSGSVGTTFTANNGAASNTTTSSRRWLLSGTAIGTGTTVTPSAAGNLVLEVTATGAGGSTVATSSPVIVQAAPVSGLDPNYPVVKMSVPAGTAGTFPPVFDLLMPAQAQADNVKYRIERYTLVNPNVIAQTYTGTITNAQATANAISGLFSSVTDPCTYRMRLESLDGATYGNWSNTVLHGDTTAPIIATATTGSVKENTKLAVALTVSNEPAGVDWAIVGGIDATKFEIVNSVLRWAGDGMMDFEDTTHGTSYVVTISATDKAGNVSTFTRTQTVTDVDEIPDDFSFADETNAAKSTAYTRSFTVAGLESGYTVPISVESGLSYKIGSGAYTTAAGTTQNGDVITVRMTSSSADATKVTGYLSIGSARRGFGVQTAIGNAAAISSVSSMPNTGFGTDVSFALNMTAGVVLLAIQRNGTQNDISNVKVDGVAATRVANSAADPGWLYVAPVATSGSKTVTFTGPTGADYSAIAVCVANATTTGATASALKTNYYNYQVTIPAVTVPTNGIGVCLIVTNTTVSDQTPSSNLKLDRIITPTSGDKIVVGSLLASGAVMYGQENGYYTAYNVALAHS